jgi:hypothetical protein
MIKLQGLKDREKKKDLLKFVDEIILSCQADIFYS